MKNNNKANSKKDTVPQSHYVTILANEMVRRQAMNERYSLRNFAADLGVESGAMSRYLNGKRVLSYQIALRMLDALNLDTKTKTAFLLSVEEETRNKACAPVNQLSRPTGNTASGRKQEPEEDLIEEQIAHREKISKAKALIDKVEVRNFNNKTLFVTTAVQGAEVEEPFLASIENFLGRHSADLIISTSKAHLKPLSDEEYPLDDILLDRYYDCVRRGVQINDHLHIRDLDVRPYVSDPLAGLAELGADDGRSYIIAHPQQRMKTYPNGMSHLPRIQWCTGALTKPLYRDNKSGLLGDKRHVIGGLIVEVRQDKFWIRAVTADVDGSFIDKGIRYNADGTIEVATAKALIRGDDHVGYQDPTCLRALDEVTELVEPEVIVVHDLTDAASVSHHRERSMSDMLDIPENINTLAKELEANRAFLKRLNATKPKNSEIVIIPSNHNEHLHKYLNERRFVNDRLNYKKAIELAYFYHVHNIDPLIYGIDPDEKLATWLRRNEPTRRICGVAISHHGDKGPNGSRGSVKGDCVSYGKSSAGHCHAPEIWRGASRVGTTSLLKMDYTIGSPSSWAHCFEVIYEARDSSALRQLMFSIDGEWCASTKKTKKFREDAKAELADASKKNGKSKKKKAS